MLSNFTQVAQVDPALLRKAVGQAGEPILDGASVGVAAALGIDCCAARVADFVFASAISRVRFVNNASFSTKAAAA